MKITIKSKFKSVSLILLYRIDLLAKITISNDSSHRMKCNNFNNWYKITIWNQINKRKESQRFITNIS